MCGADELYQKMLTALQKYCKEKKITIYALAKATGLSTSSLSNLLKGNTKPYVYTLLLICEALSISISDLFDDKTTLIEEKWIVDCYKKMSSKKKELLMIYIEMLMQYGEII